MNYYTTITENVNKHNLEQYLKGHSYENVCEIIALNDRLDLN
jgi:hypothetical protein